ncbi:MAG: Trk system potassium transporter TrkA [Rickettsiales bacterium]
MKVIICGAGRVGSSIAQQLSLENHEVTLVDFSGEILSEVAEHIDVRIYVGFPSHPEVLEEVGVQNADALIAVTRSDEVNMTACQMAHSLYNVPTKIARIRNAAYLKPEYQHLYRHDHIPIDHIISPEQEVARTIVERLHVPGAVDTIPLAANSLKALGIRCLYDCPMLGYKMQRLKSACNAADVALLGVVRGEKFILPNKNATLQQDDVAYVACNRNRIHETIELFGHEEREARTLVIIGAGNIGLSLVEYIEQYEPDVRLKLIESDASRAKIVAERLNRSTVINGDALSPAILREANVHMTETVVAVTNNDEVNILSSLIAKRSGCGRVLTIVNNSLTYADLMNDLGIDVIISPREITVSSILQHIRQGKALSLRSLCKGNVEIMEVEVTDSSPVAGKHIYNVVLPERVSLVAISRSGRLLIPEQETVILPGDFLTVVTDAASVRRVEQIFSAKKELL